MRYPAAEWRTLGRQSEPPMTAHDIICAHTMVNSLKGADRYFRTINGVGFDGTESHYGVGAAWGEDGPLDLDGVVWQWQDTTHQADANGPDGNGYVISIETADNAPRRASDIEPWTDRQVDALIGLIAWECSPAAHSQCPRSWACRKGVTWRGVQVAIPPVPIADTRPGRRGLAVHRQGVLHSRGYGVPGYLVEGGMKWSTSVGKECPGDERAEQFHAVVIPEVQRRLLSPVRPDEGDDDMELTDKVRLGPDSAAVLNQPDGVMTFEETVAVSTAAVVKLGAKVDLLRAGQAETNELLRALIALHSPTPGA